MGRTFGRFYWSICKFDKMCTIGFQLGFTEITEQDLVVFALSINFIYWQLSIGYDVVRGENYKES